MARFLASAERDGDIKSALGEEGVAVLQYRRARRADPVFDAACNDLDIAIRDSIRDRLEIEAAAGSVRAAALLAKGLGRLEASQNQDPLARWPKWVQDVVMRFISLLEAEPAPKTLDFYPACKCPKCGTEVSLGLYPWWVEPSFAICDEVGAELARVARETNGPLPKRWWEHIPAHAIRHPRPGARDPRKPSALNG